MKVSTKSVNVSALIKQNRHPPEPKRGVLQTPRTSSGHSSLVMSSRRESLFVLYYLKLNFLNEIQLLNISFWKFYAVVLLTRADSGEYLLQGSRMEFPLFQMKMKNHCTHKNNIDSFHFKFRFITLIQLSSSLITHTCESARCASVTNSDTLYVLFPE